MSEKIARLGIERDNDLMYYIKGGDVWATPRKRPGQPKGKAQKVAATGIELDYSKYLYFLDGDGDVARKARAGSGGGTRKPKAQTSKARASAAPSRTSRTSSTARTAPRSPHDVVRGSGPKSDEQLDREIAECLAQKRGHDGDSATTAADATSSGARKRRGR